MLYDTIHGCYGNCKLPHSTQSSAPKQGLWSGCTTNRRLFRCTDTCNCHSGDRLIWGSDQKKTTLKTKKTIHTFQGQNTCFGSCFLFLRILWCFDERKESTVLYLEVFHHQIPKLPGPKDIRFFYGTKPFKGVYKSSK